MCDSELNTIWLFSQSPFHNLTFGGAKKQLPTYWTIPDMQFIITLVLNWKSVENNHCRAHSEATGIKNTAILFLIISVKYLGCLDC